LIESGLQARPILHILSIQQGISPQIDMAGTNQAAASGDPGKLVSEGLPLPLGLQPLPIATGPCQPVIPHAQTHHHGSLLVEAAEFVAGAQLQAPPLAGEVELVVVGGLQDPAVGLFARILAPQRQLEVVMGVEFGQFVADIAEPVAVTHREAAALAKGHGEVGLVFRQTVPGQLTGRVADKGQQQIITVQFDLDPGVLGRPVPAGLLLPPGQLVDLTGGLAGTDRHLVDRDGQGIGGDAIAQRLPLQYQGGGGQRRRQQ